ncbi:Acyl-[acyl-carrier-protein]--UDP-N-acetylglucosamine O-acyltransferase [Melia azedarach]|uniref:Acyl-[acyl-carrier-protein]--UDP-N-acetylglucosamine O-acyltransferase n=1 Tax=Melia azedarach TaxID=155640 RepID=A0ACC1Z3H3_MELAZ|nr:Acyl-[acyl-carrier-protein]--UDP-N-acetylglucosamine O-acyltransferase [Melia azedarach]
MAGRRELGFPKTSAISFREQLARTTLHNVRAQGHTYVDLREDGKRFIFFCTLCLAPCYSDSVLFDHLKGNLHTERLSGAKVTLLGPNPWPFNDGVLFFNNSNEKQSNHKCDRLLEYHNNDSNLAIVEYGANSKNNGNGHEELDEIHLDGEIGTNGNGFVGNCEKVIPGVFLKDEIIDLKVKFIGLGQIAARLLEKDEGSSGISRIWCEWLGKKGPGDEDLVNIPDHDFGVVVFVYSYDLGRKGLFDDVKLLLSSNPAEESENGEGSGRKRKKSFSDPEDISESLSNQYDSCGEDSSASNSSTSRLLLDRYDDQLLHTRFISNKALRRELRRQQRIAAERMCDICQQKILPDKDVAALMNMKTGKLACSSRNLNGVFHVFHISCLVHWILLCEIEIMTNQPVSPKVKRRSRRKNGTKRVEARKGGENIFTNHISSPFCPECQGTGVNIDGDELEKPTISLSQMFKYKIKVSDARRAWMKDPEVLQNCSTGFHFPAQSEETFQVRIMRLMNSMDSI